jgi:hypothetical protein
MKNLLCPILTLLSAATLCAQIQVIPQVADGGGWKSTVVLVNTTATETTALLTFFKDTTAGATESWAPPFLEGSSTSINIPAGSAVFLHTSGSAAAVSQGWGQLVAGSGVVAYVIYTFTTGGRAQDATAPAVSASTRILVPFDNTNQLVTALAVVNPNAGSLSISVNFNTSSGVSTAALPTIPAQGQMAFLMPSQFSGTTGKSGLAEFYATSGSFAIIALRANPTGGFTSAPVFPENGAPIISTGTGSGGGGSIAGDITFSGFTIGKITSSAGSQEIAGGQFSAYTHAEWDPPYAGTKVGACLIYQVSYPSTALYPSAPSVFLDAGALSLSGPGLTAGTTVPKLSVPDGPVYELSLPSGTLVGGGTYTLTGSGGTQVDAFKVSATLPDNFAVTNLASITTINRSTPLTLNWTGSGFENVIINVNGTTLGSTVHQVVVTCVVPSSTGTYSIPAEALSYLPVITGGASSLGQVSASTAPAISGTVSSQSATSTTFTPNLVGGGKINYGSFAPSFTVLKSVTIQ